MIEIFKKEVLKNLIELYEANENTIAALNYGNVFRNINGVSTILDKINQTEQYDFQDVITVCDLIKGQK